MTISDADTGSPISGALVSSLKTSEVFIADENGRIDFNGISMDSIFEIRSLGYKTQQLNLLKINELGYHIKLEPRVFLLSEMVISASNWGQNSKDVISKITSIKPEDVALLNPQTAADLLGISGEVFIQKSQQGGGSPMIRGFSANRLLYTVDGVRMNNAIFRGGNIQNVISLDPFAIEMTEVLFGPGSVIYGSDAIGAVMSFRTLTPRLAMNGEKPFIGGNIVGRYSSANNERSMHADLNIGWKKWSWLTSISTFNFGDLRMGSVGPEEYKRNSYVTRIDSVDRIVENDNPLIQRSSGYSQFNLMQKLRYQPNDTWDFQYGFHYSETSEYARYDRLIETDSNGVPIAAVWKYGPQTWMMNLFQITYREPSILMDQMSIRLAHQFFEESRIDRNFSGSNNMRLRTQLEKVNAYSANIDFEKKSGRHQWYYGTEAILNDVFSRGSAENIATGNVIDVPDRYPQANWVSLAAYMNYHYRISPKWLAQAGIRYSHLQVESDFSRHIQFYPFDFTSSSLQHSATNGSVGMIFSPDSSWKFGIQASTAFRAPNVDDVGKIFDFTAGEVIVPNTSLESEYAYNLECNMSKVFGDFLKFDITGYYIYLENAMVRRTYQVNGQDSIFYNGMMSRVYAIQNAAFASVYGFNTGLQIQLTKGLTFETRYNFQNGMEELENGSVSTSRHAAPGFGMTSLKYITGPITLLLYSMYNAEISFAKLPEEERQKPAIYARDNTGNPYSPSWVTLNFKAMYNLSKKTSFVFGVENIMDIRYRPYSSGLAAPGRNILFSINVKF